MRILLVSRWLWDERHRNGDKPGFFGELFHEVAVKGVDLTILSQAIGAGPVPERHPIDGLNVHLFSKSVRRRSLWAMDKLIKPWGGYRKAATDAAVIRKFARQHGPFDVLVAQCEEPDGLACALAVRMGGMPPLVTFVHAVRTDFRAGKVRFIRKSSLGFVFRNSARVVANSDLTASLLQREYNVPGNIIGECRVHLTAPFLEMAAKPNAKTEKPEKRVLFLGALNQNKGPDLFLRAAIELAPTLPGWTFILVGPETSDEPAFRAKVQKLAADPKLAGRLEMPGRLEATAVMDEIRRARVVVCPSWVETFSRTTAEALALGRPVIVTDGVGAAPWVRVTGAGSVVKAGDAGALADTIRAWVNRVDIPNASARILSELTVAHAAQDWIREVKVVVKPAH